MAARKAARSRFANSVSAVSVWLVPRRSERGLAVIYLEAEDPEPKDERKRRDETLAKPSGP